MEVAAQCSCTVCNRDWNGISTCVIVIVSTSLVSTLQSYHQYSHKYITYSGILRQCYCSDEQGSPVCRKVCEELARVGTFEQQAVAQQRLDEIEPAARFAEYQLKKGSKTDTDRDIPQSPTTPNVQVSTYSVATIHQQEHMYFFSQNLHIEQNVHAQ